MTSPVVSNAEYIKDFLYRLEVNFPFPFQWVDKYTLDGLDVYEAWLEEQKNLVELMRSIRKAHLEKYKLSDTDNSQL